MKKSILTMILLALTMGFAKENKMEQQDKSQIEGLLAEYKAALNTSDAPKAAGLFTRDGVFMPSEAPSAVGLKNIQGSYEYVFSQIAINIEFHVEDISVKGDMAIGWTTSKFTITILANKQTMPAENRELFVFEKEDGKWKIARYMFNKMSAPPAPGTK